MKKLLIIRHAKSDWEDPKMHDFDRPLNERGKRDAPEMANRLKVKSLIPELIVSSPALRAITTAGIFAKELGIEKSAIQQEKTIYEASFTILLNVVNNFDNQYNFIALFGHNPGLTNLIQHVSPCDIYNLSTCGMALIEFPFDDWKLVSGETGQLLMYDYPKNA